MPLTKDDISQLRRRVKPHFLGTFDELVKERSDLRWELENIRKCTIRALEIKPKQLNKVK